MSKYKLAINNLKMTNCLFEASEQLYEENKRDLEALEEAVAKAEKYDEINCVVIGEGYATDDDTTDKAKVLNVFSDMHDLCCENLDLKKENEILKTKAKAFDYFMARFDREFFDRFDTYEDYMSYYEDLGNVGFSGSGCRITKEPPIPQEEFETIKKALGEKNE